MARRNSQNNKSYAWISLVVSGVALLATLVLFAGKLLEFLKIYTFEAAQIKNIMLGAWISLAVFIAGLAVYAFLEPDRIRTIFTGRQAQYGSNAFVLTLGFLAILVAVNIVAYKFPQWKVDLTETQKNSLSKETKDALGTLTENVQAFAFYSSNMDKTSAEDLLKSYQSNSNGKFVYRFVDPELDPNTAREYGVTGDGKIVLVMGEQKEFATYASEEELTSALIRLQNPVQKAVYFLTGHGEADITSSADVGYSNLKDALTAKNYAVNTLNLIASAEIPADAKVLIVAGPIKPYSAKEIELLQDYLAKGGSLIVLTNSPYSPIFASVDLNPDPLQQMLESDWGIKMNGDMVVDTRTARLVDAVVANYAQQHAITMKMNNLAAVFPYARSLVTTGTAPAEISLTPLAMTADTAWGETKQETLSGQAAASYDAGQDTPGPITLAIVAENTRTQARVAVFSSSLFAANGYFNYSGNGDLMVNSIDWSIKQENLISLNKPTGKTRSLLPMSQLVALGWMLVGACLIPVIIIVGGVVAWLSRRKRG
jgi:ABC-type uncharacterized transport system involved in gliding motility auxiliary subunit